MFSHSKNKMPVLFLGHGNPMNAIENNEYSDVWRQLALELPKPKAILCISAHWETQGVYLTSATQPETIHDFYGFPQALFDVQYPAPGDPNLAASIVDMVTSTAVGLDTERGCDHGVWSLLHPMYPAADIPVVQLSLDSRQAGQFHYDLAKQLAPLREQGVLIIGSGNIVHNLRRFSFDQSAPADWAEAFDQQVQQRILQRDHQALMDYESLSPDAALAVPTAEHYLPLLYSLALQQDDDDIRIFNAKTVSSISMTSVLIGA